MTSLAAVGALPLPGSVGAFSVGQEFAEGVILSRAHGGHPALLLKVRPTGNSAPRRLEHLTYAPPRTLELHHADGTVEGVELATLECHAEDLGVQGEFLRLAAVFLAGRQRMDEDELDARLDRLVRLFRTLSKPGLRTVQGLWGELAIIAWSSEPTKAVLAWHSQPGQIHDFAFGHDRLEVKTASGLREHHFGLEQLSTAPGGTTIVASLLVERAANGHNVEELAARIRVRLSSDPQVVERFETIVQESLGAGWRTSGEVRFDEAAARRSLKLYHARDVPCVATPVPLEVKRVKMLVDLSYAPVTPLSEVRALGGEFPNLLPSGSP